MAPKSPKYEIIDQQTKETHSARSVNGILEILKKKCPSVTRYAVNMSVTRGDPLCDGRFVVTQKSGVKSRSKAQNEPIPKRKLKFKRKKKSMPDTAGQNVQVAESLAPAYIKVVPHDVGGQVPKEDQKGIKEPDRLGGTEGVREQGLPSAEVGDVTTRKEELSESLEALEEEQEEKQRELVEEPPAGADMSDEDRAFEKTFPYFKGQNQYSADDIRKYANYLKRNDKALQNFNSVAEKNMKYFDFSVKNTEALQGKIAQAWTNVVNQGKNDAEDIKLINLSLFILFDRKDRVDDMKDFVSHKVKEEAIQDTDDETIMSLMKQINETDDSDTIKKADVLFRQVVDDPDIDVGITKASLQRLLTNYKASEEKMRGAEESRTPTEQPVDPASPAKSDTTESYEVEGEVEDMDVNDDDAVEGQQVDEPQDQPQSEPEGAATDMPVQGEITQGAEEAGEQAGEVEEARANLQDKEKERERLRKQVEDAELMERALTAERDRLFEERLQMLPDTQMGRELRDVLLADIKLEAENERPRRVNNVIAGSFAHYRKVMAGFDDFDIDKYRTLFQLEAQLRQLAVGSPERNSLKVTYMQSAKPFGRMEQNQVEEELRGMGKKPTSVSLAQATNKVQELRRMLLQAEKQEGKMRAMQEKERYGIDQDQVLESLEHGEEEHTQHEDDFDDEEVNMAGSGLLDSANLGYPQNMPYHFSSEDIEDEYRLLAYQRRNHLQPGMKEEYAHKSRSHGYRNFRRPEPTLEQNRISDGGVRIAPYPGRQSTALKKNVMGEPMEQKPYYKFDTEKGEYTVDKGLMKNVPNDGKVPYYRSDEFRNLQYKGVAPDLPERAPLTRLQQLEPPGGSEIAPVEPRPDLRPREKMKGDGYNQQYGHGYVGGRGDVKAIMPMSDDDALIGGRGKKKRLGRTIAGLSNKKPRYGNAMNADLRGQNSGSNAAGVSPDMFIGMPVKEAAMKLSSMGFGVRIEYPGRPYTRSYKADRYRVISDVHGEVSRIIKG